MWIKREMLSINKYGNNQAKTPKENLNAACCF